MQANWVEVSHSGGIFSHEKWDEKMKILGVTSQLGEMSRLIKKNHM